MAERSLARSTPRYEKKREAILDAATQILNRAGVRGLTLGDAAAAVGLSTTSVTYYFKRKEDLAAACLMRGIETLYAIAEAACAEATPEARLRKLLALHFERLRQGVAGEAPPLPVLNDLRALNPPRKAQVFEAFMRVFRKVRQVFDGPELAALSRGRKTARTHMLLEQLFWAEAWLRRYDPEDYARLAERVSGILSGGLAQPQARWAPEAMDLEEIAGADPQEISRETFLLAATRLINSRGYRGASVELISAELNVTKGSFYHHIDAKDDLVVACFERTFEVMRRVQRKAMAGSGDQWSKLVDAAATLAEYQLSDYGPLLRTSALSAVPEHIRGKMVEQSNRVSDRFAGMISDGIAEGSIRPVDPFIAAQMLNATLNAGAELSFWVPGVKQKAAPAVFVRPLLMGIFELPAPRGG
ncbi:TetR/AcrR family transcriptional regulator [Phenylobacterium sp.]|jgi:AcrR family transcriptional regulator|uniref:TetR/AcrR family transcriptional regulator n=1 Tax=Phenylobacterium sp. TaxID=1871053 RepID=UPI002E32988B|nr:TetR/AcrR family transcriptional regulator [Phenylobacterium sp.]HEX2560674.1 TetR/AcrR family transcriptional regulator [Phenylobacterium sp.]